MDLVIITGPPAVGKMTVGKALSARTGLRLLHNHVSLELANRFFDFGTPPFRRLDRTVRFAVFREVAASDLPGLIFTVALDFDDPEDTDYVDEIADIFTAHGARVHIASLSAPLAVRRQRNRGDDRIAEKPSKRDLEFSDGLLVSDEDRFRMVPRPGDLGGRAFLLVDNTELPAEAVADRIITACSLPTVP